MMEYPSHPQHAQQYLRHDAETFRVAEELMMLSNCAVTSGVGSADSYSHHHVGKKLNDEQKYSAGSYEQVRIVFTIGGGERGYLFYYRVHCVNAADATRDDHKCQYQARATTEEQVRTTFALSCTSIVCMLTLWPCALFCGVAA